MCFKFLFLPAATRISTENSNPESRRNDNFRDFSLGYGQWDLRSEILQIIIRTFESTQFRIWSQIQNVKIVPIHRKSEQFGELRFADS